jgi:hypothetical protein
MKGIALFIESHKQREWCKYGYFVKPDSKIRSLVLVGTITRKLTMMVDVIRYVWDIQLLTVLENNNKKTHVQQLHARKCGIQIGSNFIHQKQRIFPPWICVSVCVFVHQQCLILIGSLMCLPVGTMAWIHTFTRLFIRIQFRSRRKHVPCLYISEATSSAQYIRS